MERYASLCIITLLAYLITLSCSNQSSGQINPGITLSNATPQPDLKLLAEGFIAPVQIISLDDGTDRMFAVDQIGLIRVIKEDGTLLKDPLLDLSSKIVKLNPSNDERGLLSIAIHPDFKNRSRIFVCYSAQLKPGAPKNWDHTDRVSEFN